MTTSRSRSLMTTMTTMKLFNIEKLLRTGSSSGSESRLGTFRLIVPSYSAPNGNTDITTTPGPGSVSEQRNDNGEEVVYKTPMYFIHTQTGSIPHITPEVLKLIYTTTPSGPGTPSQMSPLQISVDSTIRFAESLQRFGKGVGKFVGLPQVPVFLTVHDSLQPLKSGHNDKFGIALWSRHGRTLLTPENFAQIMLTGYKPSLCQILSDYDVQPKSSGVKRLKKSLYRAEEYTDHVIKQKSSEKFSEINTGLFITIEAAWFEMEEELRRKTVAKLLESQHQLEGIVIAGLTDRFTVPKVPVPETAKSKSKSSEKDKKKERVEPDKLDVCVNLNTALLDKVVQNLPPSLPKYVPGPFSLPQMVDLISRGVDILDTSITTKMADNAEVLILDRVEAILPSISMSAERMGKGDNESLAERGRGVANEKDVIKNTYEEGSAVVSLKDKQFFDDFRPLSNNCTCHSCRKHTRSYIHHLYATDELLGPVLVQIHNLTAIDRFFEIIRGVLQDSDSAETLQENLTMIKYLLKESKKIAKDLDDVENNCGKSVTVMGGL